MKNNYFLLIFIFFLFTSCFAKYEIIVNEDIIKSNCEFLISDTSNIKVRINNNVYAISNLDKFKNNEDNWYALFNLNEEKTIQLLVVYLFESNTVDYCYFYPDTSHFFEEDLICFSIKIEPNQYPLQKLYEITTSIKDFKKSYDKTYVEHSRYWLTSNNNIQDFYYKKPFFYKTDNKSINKNYISAVDKKYIQDDVIFYVLWEQAHFPVNCTYYYLNRKKTGEACAYPEINNSEVYKTFESELKPIDETNLISGDIQISLILDKNKELNYENCSIKIIKTDISKEYLLSEIFPFKDVLQNVKLAESLEGYASFIVTTNMFSYDVLINLSTDEIDVFLRASSFPEENRALE